MKRIGRTLLYVHNIARWRRGIRWFWVHRRVTGFGCVIGGFLLLNGVVFMHARAMTHFVPSGTRTVRQGEEIFQNLAGVKQFEAFDDLGHESYVACDRKHWVRVVSRFLEDLERQ
jgi:hypothetical protein